MLVLRKEQMEALSDAMRRRFIERVDSHLNAVFPDILEEMSASRAGDNERWLEAYITDLISRAESIDIVSQADVARYISFITEFGEQFETKREMLWAAKLLANKKLSGTARMSLLYEHLTIKFPDSRIALSTGR